MTISLCLTVHNRPPAVSKAVADSLLLPGNAPDELILVLDRPTPDALEGAHAAYDNLPFPVRTITIPGKPAWLGPARAWNHAFTAASSDTLYCISSEVVQAAGNLDRARSLADPTTAVFGACHNSTPAQLVTGAEPGLLASSKMPRPLGFIVAMPAPAVKAIEGFDEDFMHGFWFDDDDFFLRLWHSGIHFSFNDSIHGTHIHHERPDLETPAGQDGITRNQALMLRKHGTTSPWNTLPRITHYGDGITTWRHP